MFERKHQKIAPFFGSVGRLAVYFEIVLLLIGNVLSPIVHWILHKININDAY